MSVVVARRRKLVAAVGGVGGADGAVAPLVAPLVLPLVVAANIWLVGEVGDFNGGRGGRPLSGLFFLGGV